MVYTGEDRQSTHSMLFFAHALEFLAAALRIHKLTRVFRALGEFLVLGIQNLRALLDGADAMIVSGRSVHGHNFPSPGNNKPAILNRLAIALPFKIFG
jgi:hypothetical protein